MGAGLPAPMSVNLEGELYSQSHVTGALKYGRESITAGQGEFCVSVGAIGSGSVVIGSHYLGPVCLRITDEARQPRPNRTNQPAASEGDFLHCQHAVLIQQIEDISFER